MTSQELEQRTPAQVLVAGVRSDTFKQQIGMALPPTVTPERFVRVAVTAIQQNADLAEADHDSIIRSLIRCAADGLLPDGREAALVIFNNKVKTPTGDQWVKSAQYMPMIGGFRKIAAEFGWTLRTRVVHANDDFEYGLDTETLDEKLVHRPARPGTDRGALVAAYAIAAHKDGRREVEVMYGEDIAKARGVSRAKDRGPWVDWEERMWEKTVGRRLFAKLPLGELDERVTRILEASDTEPVEAARLIYGPPRTETPAALPARTGTSETDETATSPPTQAEQSTAGASQQAATAATSPAAVAAPGAPDDEPALDEASPFQPPAAAEEDPVVAAGLAASQFQIPNGQHKGIPLAELLQKGDKGTSWLRWALRKGDELTPLEYRTAVWSFARVYAPDVYQEVLAEHEARS
jgi:phage RecT family recombinase